jgi:predicted transcriptional regulator
MENELEKLKKYLPKGFTDMLAKEFGVTGATVTGALQGKTRRFDIIKRAVKMAKENVEIHNELKETVNGIES